MSGIIFFVSGKQLRITEAEFSNISPKLAAKGVRCQVTTDGHIIPLNSSTIEMIEHVPESELEDQRKLAEVIVDEIEKDERTVKERRDEIDNDMIAKSNCTHPDQTLYKQQTAKGLRFFPVCDFCGKRERYVSEKKVIDGAYPEWNIEDVDNAKTWVED